MKTTYAFQKTRANFGSLRVQSDSDGDVDAGAGGQILLRLAHIVDRPSVVLVGAVGEVQPSDVHARLDHLLQGLHGSGRGSDRADDAGQADEGRAAAGVQGAHVVQLTLGVQCLSVRLTSHLRKSRGD